MPYCNWGFMTGFGGGGGGFGFGFLLNLLVLGLLGFLAYRLIQRFSDRSGGDRDRRDSLEILKRKYASGDISEEEYRRIRNILDS